MQRTLTGGNQMEYKVRIVVTEVYEAYVEAPDWETAEELAGDQLNNGELEIVSESTTFEAEEVDA